MRPTVMMREFLGQESAAGFVLMGAAAIGLIWANSPFYGTYSAIQHAKFGFPGFVLSTHQWVDEALMALFFLLVGLEIKREVLEGELSTPARAFLPAVAALGGMVVPALICTAFVWNDPDRLSGWAIPMATDIAFALAVLSLVGKRIAMRLKVIVTALAVIDDLGAILVIAVFYTSNLAIRPLLAALVCLAALVLLNRMRVTALFAYLAIGAAMWYFVLQSGIHATIAGVALALTIPTASLRKLEHGLHPYVAFGVVPVFGLVNAGVSFRGLSPAILATPLPLGIALGLFLGKQAGIFGFTWAAVKMRLVSMPAGLSWPAMYGIALLGGIGFTMSLFIGTLAFESDALLTETKIGVMAGSLLAALCGMFLLRAVERRAAASALATAASADASA